MSGLREKERPANRISKYLKPDEFDSMLSAAKTERDRLLLEVLWGTGLRISEALGIRPRDIDADGGYVEVIHQKVRGPRRTRLVNIERELAKQMLDYAVQKGIRDDVPLFGMNRMQAFYVIRSLGKRAKLNRDVSPHVLRHGFAILAVKSGIDVTRLGRMLGHRSLSSTMAYLDFSPQDLKESYEAVRTREREDRRRRTS